MRHRIGSLILGLATMLATSAVFALGLGEIDLKSNLNQRLEAEIELLEVRDLSESEIIIKLGSPDDFDRLGVERIYFLTDLKFNVELDSAKGPVVKVSSNRLVREPFLNFIVEARWPSGKLLREYTLLLDLPVFSDEATAPISPVQTQTVGSSQAEPDKAVTQARADTDSTVYNPRSSFGDSNRSVSSPRASAPTYEGDTYHVRSNDTLWEIALSVRPGRNVSVHQTMLALQRENPEAFINGNINLLKSGQILRIPDRSYIEDLSNRQAQREVAHQNRQWASDTGAAPLEASSSSLSSYDERSSGEGRLSLLSPDDSVDAEQGRISGGTEDSSPTATAMQRELAETKESLDLTRSENTELRGKIDSLEEQISTLESMIEISNQSLRDLERQSALNNQSEDLDAASEDAELVEDGEIDTFSGDTDTLADEDEIIDGEDELVAEEVDEVVAGSEAVEESASLAEKAAAEDAREVNPAKVVLSAPKKESGLIDFVMEYIAFIGLFLIALIGLVIYFLKQRSQAEEDDFDDFLAPIDDVEETPYDAFEEQQDEQDEQDIVEPPSAEEEDEYIAEDEHVDEDESSEAETEDVVAESDIYIAYGKYDQAEEMLLKALNTNPGYHEARLKLLEIYAAQDNIEGFDPNYATLRAANAPDTVLARAASLRESIAGAPEFDESLYTTGEFVAVPDEEDLEGQAEELADEDMDFDLHLEDVDAEVDGVDTSETQVNYVVDDEEVETEEVLDEVDLEEGLELGDSLELEDDDAGLEVEGSVEISDAGSNFDDNSLELDLEGLEDELETVKDASGEFDVSDLDIDFDEDDEAPVEGSELDLDLDGLDFGLEEDQEVASSSDLLEGDVEDALDLELTDSGLELELTEGEVITADDGLDLDVDLEDSEEVSELASVLGDETDDLEIDAPELEVAEPEIVLEDDDLELDLDGELERDLEALDSDLEAITGDGQQPAESQEADLDDVDLDSLEMALESETLVDLDIEGAADDINVDSDELDVDAAADLDNIVESVVAEEVVEQAGDLADAPVGETSEEAGAESLGSEEDDTFIRKLSEFEEKQDEEKPAPSEDDLSLTGTNFDIAQLDRELEALTSDLSDEEDQGSADVGVELELDDGPGSIVASADGEAEQLSSVAESGETLPDFEQFDLDDDDSDLDTSLAGAEKSTLEEPDLAFDEPDDFEEDAEDDVPGIALDEPELDFDEGLDASIEEISAASEAPSTGVEETEKPTETDASEELDFELPEIDPEAADDDDLDFLASSDETATKLDLAAAYIDMGDTSGAKEIIDEIMREGNDDQKAEATQLLAKIAE